MRWRLSVVPVAAVALSGCVSTLVSLTGVLTEEQAPRYASLAPFEFVRVRFHDEEQWPLLDGVDAALRPYIDALDPHAGVRREARRLRRPELQADAQLVTWPAYFTNVNYIQLLRPVAELRRYCKVRGGQWRTVQAYVEDPMKVLRRDPLAAYISAQAWVKRHHPGWPDVMAANIGQEMAEEAANNNRSVDSLFSVQGFGYAQRLEAFGTFACDEQGGGWAVSVLPTTMLPGDPKNGLESSMARLAIRTYEGRGR